MPRTHARHDPFTGTYNTTGVATVPLGLMQAGEWRTVAAPADGDYTLELANRGSKLANVTWALAFQKQHCYTSATDFISAAAAVYAGGNDHSYHAFLVDDRNYLPYVSISKSKG